MHAARHGAISAVKILIDAGADVNVRDADGETCLMKAAFWGHIEVVELLLASGRT